MQELFNTNQSKVVLARFKTKIDGLTPTNDFETSRNSLIRLVVNSMEVNPDQWNGQCQINIGWIGDHFINRLSDEEKELNKERLDDICSMCFRFLFELYLSIKNDLSMEFEQARRFVFNNLEEFEHDAREQIEYAIRDMPINILKQLSNNEAIDSIKDFNKVSAKAQELKSNWDQEIEDKEKEVNRLKEALDEYKTAFNFVGLYDGFDDLAKEKNKELKGLSRGLKVMAIVVVCPIIAELVLVYLRLNDISSIKDILLVSILPTLSLAAISIYYFRVLLFNYRSIKSQLIQIELRKTLCRFIQHYSDYSQKIKEKDKDSLAKFENIIFSGIVTEEGNLPSTYDGIEQIANLIKSAKG